MSRIDGEASAALGGRVIRPVFFAFLDILGDPLRANTSGRTIAFAGTGNPDLDGHSFDGISPDIVDIGPVRMKDGGSDTVRAQLSGLLQLDDELLNVVGNPANWLGRPAQLWRMIRDEQGNQRGAVQHYYTGYMVALSIAGDPDGGQTIEVSIESYLAAFSQASHRTYLDQDQYDAGDLSARAAIAIANGISGDRLVSNTPVGGGGGGGPPSWKFGQQEILR